MAPILHLILLGHLAVRGGCCRRICPTGRRSITNARVWRIDGTRNAFTLNWCNGNGYFKAIKQRQCREFRFAIDENSPPAAIEVGFDGGKKIKGRKRHWMVDTLDLVMRVVVTAANISDQQGARVIFARLAQLSERIAGGFDLGGWNL